MQEDQVRSPITGRAIILASDRVKEYRSLIESAGSDPESPTLDFMTDSLGPSETIRVLDSISKAMDRNPNLKVRFMTDVQDENIRYVKELLAAGVEIRHVEGIDKNVAITRTRFVQTIHTFEETRPNELLISSEDQDVITLLSNVFQTLWDTKITAEKRIREIEERAELGETKLIREPGLIAQYTKGLLLESKDEVRLVLPSSPRRRSETSSTSGTMGRSRSPTWGTCGRKESPPETSCAASLLRIRAASPRRRCLRT